MNILDDEQIREFRDILGQTSIVHLNNTTLMHGFIIDLCQNSNPEQGIRLSPEFLYLMNEVKKFNYKYIYKHKRLNNYAKYADLILNSIYDTLLELYQGEQSVDNLRASIKIHPTLSSAFSEWLRRYAIQQRATDSQLQNELLYNLNLKSDYIQAIIDFIASLTDRMAIDLFEELTRF
jgi:dGTPase